MTMYSPIRSDMSDLEIVSEIIRVVGYERLEIIIDMLEDRIIKIPGLPHLKYQSRKEPEIGVVPNPDFPWPGFHEDAE